MRFTLACCVLLAACGQNNKTQCMNVGGHSELVTDAKLLKLDIYPDTVACAGAEVPAGSVPILSKTFKPGDEIKLDVPPGTRTLVLTTYGDDAGTVLIGTGCTTSELKPGAQVCINLSILPAPDIAVVNDLSSVDLLMCQGSDCPCTIAPNDNCPAGQFCDGAMCQLGCKEASDCVGVGPANDGGMPRTTCNTSTHMCVECTSNDQCPLGKLCSPSGVCTIGCDATHACPGALTCCNSLCIDITTDVNNCGACNNPCNVGGATTCCSSTCVNLNSNADNCGSCGRSCSSNGVKTRGCTTGACTPACAFGNGDCVHPSPGPDDGCETLLNTLTNCGVCNQKCDAASGHGTPTCNLPDAGTASCTWSCTSPFGNCDTNAPDTNGCETNLNTDATHCGGCPNPCDTINSNGAACSSGSCTYSGCKAHHGDCNNTSDPKNLQGCETPTTSPSNCGGCSPCDSNHNASAPTCVPSGSTDVCVYSCTAPFIDCNNAAPNTSGCEINSGTDNMNCVACGNVCTATNASNPTCSGTRCSYTCNGGKANCNTNTVDLDGCECDSASVATEGTVGGCCTNACQNKHSTGIGAELYYDCVALNTINQAQATKACTAHTGNAAKCTMITCTGGAGAIQDAADAQGNCQTWAYGGTHAGTVFDGTNPTCPSGGCGCFCPGAGWQNWQ